MRSEAPVSGDTADALLRRLVDTLSAMLAYWDAGQRCRFANRAYERWFGVSPEALIGTHLSELLGPLYALNLPYIEAALRGEPQQFEREIPDPAGGPPRHSLANYIPDIADGVVRGFFVHVSDVSEIKRAELARAESEARFAGIVAMSTDAIISVDHRHQITIFNAGAEQIFGYTAAEMIGRDLGMLLPERFREAHSLHVAGFVTADVAARTISARKAMIIGRRKDGAEFPAEAAISKLEVGGKLLMTVALRDITERRRIEQDQEILAEAGGVLASSLDYTRTLKSIAELVVRHAADLCVVDMVADADHVQRLTAAHADPAKAAACAALARIAVDQRHTLARSALETGRPQIFDDITPEFMASAAQNAAHLEVLRELAPRSAMVVPLVVADRVLGAVSFVSSHPRRYGQRDLELATELARRAALAIENARLYEAAQRATQARDDLLGIVAHDVRSPLNAIFLAAELLHRRLETSGLRDGEAQVASILRSTERANRLIEDLLDVTRIEGGALTIRCSALAPRPVVGDALDSQRVLAAAAAIELELEVDEELPEIWVDRDRFLQVIENLVGNALKFTPKGGLITVTAVERPGEVVFSVADTGPGIPPDNLPYIFDRFWQAARAKRQGAGLGLPICKGIVEAHGGRIWVDSTVGVGTTVCFTMPAAAGPEATKAVNPTSPTASGSWKLARP